MLQKRIRFDKLVQGVDDRSVVTPLPAIVVGASWQADCLATPTSADSVRCTHLSHDGSFFVRA